VDAVFTRSALSPHKGPLTLTLAGPLPQQTSGVLHPPGTNAPLPRRRVEGTFVLGRGTTRYKCDALYWVSRPVQMLHHICTGCFVPVGYTNEGFQLVQMPLFPVVYCNNKGVFGRDSSAASEVVFEGAIPNTLQKQLQTSSNRKTRSLEQKASAGAKNTSFPRFISSVGPQSATCPVVCSVQARGRRRPMAGATV
jgi:hypothetical protein